MGLLLRQIRLENGWTQEFVAQNVGVTPEAISMIETGKRKPSYDVLVRLLDLYGYSDPKQLFSE